MQAEPLVCSCSENDSRQCGTCYGCPGFRARRDSINLDGQPSIDLAGVGPYYEVSVRVDGAHNSGLIRVFLNSRAGRMSTPSSELRTVIERLPFGVDDTDAANNVFRQWVEEGDPRAERLVDLWTYCYVCRYFLTKSAGDAFNHTSDADELSTRAFRKVQQNRSDVRDPGRYAHWVSVVCKNTFLNYTRRDRYSESIEKKGGPNLTADSTLPVSNTGFVREALTEAINRLPNYLQEPARLYFLEEREFDEISEQVDKSVATVRTYKYKAVKKLRADERLREYIDQIDM